MNLFEAEHRDHTAATVDACRRAARAARTRHIRDCAEEFLGDHGRAK